MNPNSKKQHILSVRSGIIVGMVCLGVFMSSRIVPIIRGPQINLESIPEHSEVSEPLIKLSGTITHSKKATINGTDLFMTPDGKFNESILLNTGYNAITFQVSDALGHTKEKQYAFVLKENETGTFAVSTLPSQN